MSLDSSAAVRHRPCAQAERLAPEQQPIRRKQATSETEPLQRLPIALIAVLLTSVAPIGFPDSLPVHKEAVAVLRSANCARRAGAISANTLLLPSGKALSARHLHHRSVGAAKSQPTPHYPERTVKRQGATATGEDAAGGRSATIPDSAGDPS